VVAVPKTKRALKSAIRRRQRAVQSRMPALRDTVRHRLGMTRGGRVEEFSRRHAQGWVNAAVDAKPIRVSVHIDDLEVAAGWATSWRAEPSSNGEHRYFTLRLAGIWKYCQPTNKLTVRADGELLPITGHGMYLVPAQAGRSNLKRLRALMAEGYVLGQKGRLQLSKNLDTNWQEGVLGLYAEVREILAEAYGYDLFIAYGSLLGAVREGGFIGHDLDFDSAFVSKHTDGADAAAELRDIALLLIDRGFLERGYTIGHQKAHLNLQSIEQPGIRIDIFHNYFDSSGHLRFPFGSAGSTKLEQSDWEGTKEIDFVGHRVLVPTNSEQFVEVVYGTDWRIPQPGFFWPRDRTDRAEEAHLPLAYHQTIYWASFYARTGFAKGSSFFEKVDGFPGVPGRIIDIGCGDGRDSHAFGLAGRSVVGIDRSAVGVQHASDKAVEMGVSDRVRFEVCDVAGDPRPFLTSVTADPDEAVLFYLRFFLHSVPEDVQHQLMQTIADVARPGDMFAAEFRTDKDEARSKTYGEHYRRFQNGPAFGRALHQRYGFEVLEEEEGTGLSVYGDEDPELYRVIARR
jgi:Methyltransferase domain